MDNSLIVAAIGLGSGAVGGAINWLLVRRREIESHHRAVRQELYGSFIDSMWTAVVGEEAERKPALNKYATLANKIAIYGSDEVVNRLAPVMKSGQINEDTEALWVELIVTMRMDVGLSKDDNTANSVREIMFKREGQQLIQSEPAQPESVV